MLLRVGLFQTRKNNDLHIGAKKRALEKRRESLAAVAAYMQSMRAVSIIVHIREVGDYSGAARDATNALKPYRSRLGCSENH